MWVYQLAGDQEGDAVLASAPGNYGTLDVYMYGTAVVVCNLHEHRRSEDGRWPSRFSAAQSIKPALIKVASRLWYSRCLPQRTQTPPCPPWRLSRGWCPSEKSRLLGMLPCAVQELFGSAGGSTASVFCTEDLCSHGAGHRRWSGTPTRQEPSHRISGETLTCAPQSSIEPCIRHFMAPWSSSGLHAMLSSPLRALY